jgi:hypothetical protein
VPDLVVPLEKAVLAWLKADAAVTAIIPTTQIYPQRAPATPLKPFCKPGTQIAAPYTGHRRRREIRFPVYIRADARKNGSEIIETARDHMGRCVGAIVDSLYRARLPVSGGTAQFVLINDIRRMVDGEADAMEGNIEFRARVMAG